MRFAVIMAGGYGERFWPLSRKSRPKQCIPISSDKPMIQDTIERLEPLFKDEIYISTSKPLADEIKKSLPDAKFILEPIPKNTAACIGLSSIQLLQKDPDAVMFLETSDHIYKDPKAYLNHVEYALKIAENEDKIVLIGIQPTSPHTGFGYIELGDKVHDESIKVHNVSSFREKPDLKTAEEFLKSRNFLWNSGMFIAKCSVMLDEIKTHMPGLYASLQKIKDSNFDEQVLKAEFEKLESISADYGIMEKSKNTYVLKADIHWDDVGDLAAFDRFMEKDENGNVLKGNTVMEDSKHNIVLGKDKMIALIGVHNLIIAETDDVILVADKNRAQDVKKIVKKLSEKEETKKYVE